MYRLPKELYTVAQGRELDRRAMNVHELADGKLMELAGKEAFNVFRELWPGARTIAVCCGPGNNGGDGLVLAELAFMHGYDVQLIKFGDPKNKHCKKLFERIKSYKIPQLEIKPQMFAETDVIVDAIFGTGLKRRLDGLVLQGVREINQSGKPILSLDIPTGLDSDTGTIWLDAVTATATISFISLKLGIFMADGVEICGQLLFSDLNVAQSLTHSMEPICRRIDVSLITEFINGLKKPRHKGEVGHLIVIGGSRGMSGATYLAGQAALRSGAGRVTVLTHPNQLYYWTAVAPEIMAHAIVNGRDLAPYLKTATAILIGPGLGVNNWSKSLMAEVLESQLPTVVDADALNLLSQNIFYKENWILTPHPGEAGRLLCLSSAEVQRDRLKAAKQIQKKYGGNIVLKGAGTLVYSNNGDMYLCDQGNFGMATAGMGDVLAGTIGGLVSLGLNNASASLCGTWIHSAAGDIAGKQGQRGMIASDLFPYIRILMDNPSLIHE